MRLAIYSRLKRQGLLLLTLSIVACSSSNDEQRVRAVIGGIETAVESRDSSDALKLVADDYTDTQGLDKAQLKNFLRGYFLTHPKIEVALRIDKVEFETANRARIRVDVILLGTQLTQSAANGAGETGSGSGNAPTELAGDAETLQVELKREQSQWLVTRVDRISR